MKRRRSKDFIFFLHSVTVYFKVSIVLFWLKLTSSFSMRASLYGYTYLPIVSCLKMRTSSLLKKTFLI